MYLIDNFGKVVVSVNVFASSSSGVSDYAININKNCKEASNVKVPIKAQPLRTNQTSFY